MGMVEGGREEIGEPLGLFLNSSSVFISCRVQESLRILPRGKWKIMKV